jgi:glycosyltransferase involved in cell wall biosynthesis
MALSRWLPFCRRKIHIVPNGVPDMPQPSPSVNETDPFILYVGRIVPQKRIDLLIESFRQVQCDIKLILAGPTSHSYKYVSYLRSLSDGDRRIVWRGDTNHRELMLLYRQCTAVVLPSDHEGYSNVLLEALSAGCCIIASDIEENVAILRDAGLFFPNGNQEALTVLLQQIADERVPLQRLRYDAIIRSTQLPTWDDVVRRILRLCIPHFDTRTTTSRCP